ncbi:MAG: hypothetical protein ABJA81_09090, partial [Nocardioidaceae bacterium]
MSNTTGAQVEEGSPDPVPPNRLRGRSLTRAIGLTFAFTAIAVVGYAGWQHYGSDASSKQRLASPTPLDNRISFGC